MRVAIVHDWLIGGGAEKVVLELHRLYPEAPIYTSYASRDWIERLDGKVVTSYLQLWPFSRLRKFLPVLRAYWFSHLNLAGYDLVISSSGAEAKGIKVSKNTVHINYCHAPTHYYWSRYEEYLQNPGFGPLNWLARIGLTALVGPMRKWDYKAAQRPDFMIANSTYTQSEIKKYYGRDSFVIHPPVQLKSNVENQMSTTGAGFVITGRQTSYKRVDLAVAACTELGLQLTVIGNGPEHTRLVAMAGPTVTFLTDVTDEEMPSLLAGAQAFIFPGIDDFGISPVEAMSVGTPVIAFKAGGALDYVVEGQTGEFFKEQTVDSLSEVISKFDADKFDENIIKGKAQAFSAENFQKKVLEFINKCMIV